MPLPDDVRARPEAYWPDAGDALELPATDAAEVAPNTTSKAWDTEVSPRCFEWMTFEQLRQFVDMHTTPLPRGANAFGSTVPMDSAARVPLRLRAPSGRCDILLLPSLETLVNELQQWEARPTDHELNLWLGLWEKRVPDDQGKKKEEEYSVCIGSNNKWRPRGGR